MRHAGAATYSANGRRYFGVVRRMDAGSAGRWRRAGTEPIDDAILKAIRISLRDPVARYFDDDDDPDCRSPRLERATQIELLRLVSNTLPSALRKSNLDDAAAMRRALLRPEPDEPPRSVPDAWGAALLDFGQRYGVWTGTPALELRRFDQTGRGLASSVDLEAGEPVLTIPESLLLGSEGVLSHPQIGPALHEIAHNDSMTSAQPVVSESSAGGDGEDEEVMEGVLHGDILLALALLLEPILRPGGAWSEYCAYLPEAPPSALNWSRAQLQRMVATPLPQQVCELRAVLLAAHGALFPTLSHRLPHLFPPDAFSWNRFVWAYTVVQSRGLVIGGDAAMRQRRTVLVPVADMLNHSARSQLAWPTLEASEHEAGGRELAAGVSAGGALVTGLASAGLGPSAGNEATHGQGGAPADAPPGERSLTFRTLCPVRRGDQVFLYYGRLSCLQTLEHYGFVCRRALEREVVAVDLEPPEEKGEEEADLMPSQEEGREKAEAADTEAGERRELEAEQTGQLRLRMMQRYGLVHYLRASGPLPGKLLGALRVGTAPASELRRVASMGTDAAAGPLSQSSETECCAALGSILDAMEAGLELGADASGQGQDQAVSQAIGEEQAVALGVGGAGAGGTANRTVVCGRSEHTGDGHDVDRAIDLYVDFQRRVIHHARAEVERLAAAAKEGDGGDGAKRPKHDALGI